MAASSHLVALFNAPSLHVPPPCHLGTQIHVGEDLSAPSSTAQSHPTLSPFLNVSAASSKSPPNEDLLVRSLDLSTHSLDDHTSPSHPHTIPPGVTNSPVPGDTSPIASAPGDTVIAACALHTLSSLPLPAPTTNLASPSHDVDPVSLSVHQMESAQVAGSATSGSVGQWEGALM